MFRNKDVKYFICGNHVSINYLLHFFYSLILNIRGIYSNNAQAYKVQEDDSDQYEEDNRIPLVDFIQMNAIGRQIDVEEEDSDQYEEDVRISLVDFIRLNNGPEYDIDENIFPVEGNGKT